MEKFFAYCKLSSNFVALSLKAVFENFLHFKPPGDYLDNIKNDKMNNLTSIDYAVKDFTHDSDLVLPRWTQEYPRLSSSYQSKLGAKPWGEKDEPVYFDYTLDSRIRQDFKTGVWYHTSMTGAEHSDLAGFPNPFFKLQTLLGL